MMDGWTLQPTITTSFWRQCYEAPLGQHLMIPGVSVPGSDFHFKSIFRTDTHLQSADPVKQDVNAWQSEQIWVDKMLQVGFEADTFSILFLNIGRRGQLQKDSEVLKSDTISGGQQRFSVTRRAGVKWMQNVLQISTSCVNTHGSMCRAEINIYQCQLFILVSVSVVSSVHGHSLSKVNVSPRV